MVPTVCHQAHPIPVSNPQSRGQGAWWHHGGHRTVTLHGDHSGDATILLPPSPAPSLPQPPTTLLSHPCAAGEMWDVGQGNTSSHQHSSLPSNLPMEVLPQHPQPTSSPVLKGSKLWSMAQCWPHGPTKCPWPAGEGEQSIRTERLTWPLLDLR